MGLASKLGCEGDSASDHKRATRVAPIGGGVGGAVGAALGVLVAGSTTEVALFAGAGAGMAVLATWLALAVFG